MAGKERASASYLSPDKTTAVGQSRTSLNEQSVNPNSAEGGVLSTMKKTGEHSWVRVAGSTAETPQEYYKMMQTVRSGKSIGRDHLQNRARSQHEARKAEPKKRPGSSFVTAR